MSDSIDGVGIHQDASDVYYDRPCESCSEDGKNIEAIIFCPTCDTFLCQKCLKVHSRLASSKSHPVLQGDEMPKSVDEKPVKYPYCTAHARKMKDRYCLNHEIMVCENCQAEAHVSCIVHSIADVCKIFDQATMRHLADSTSDARERATTAKNYLQSDSDRMEKSRKCMLSDAKELYTKSIDFILGLYKETQSKIEDTFSDRKRDIARQTEDMSTFIRRFDDLSVDLNKLRGIKFNERAFIRFQELLADINETRDDCEKVVDAVEYKEISFKVSAELQTFLVNCSAFGNVSVEKAKVRISSEGEQNVDLSEIKVTERGKLNASIKGDKLACFITGIAIRENGDILAIDWNNNKVKLFSPDGNLLSFLELSSLKLTYWPCEICFVDDNTAIVCLSGTNRHHILKISDTNSITIERNISLSGTNKSWSVTPYDLELVVACGSKPDVINVLKMNGEVDWAVEKDKQGQRLFENISCVATLGKYSRKVVVADKEKASVSLLHVDRGEILHTCTVDGRIPKKVTVDRNGHVYVYYNETKEIVVWSEDLSKSICLVGDLKREPTAIAFNQKNGELLISYESCDVVDRLACD